MNLNQLKSPEKLERLSFLWSEVRLVIAAVALAIGGRPPLLALLQFQGMYNFGFTILKLSWIISGATAVYLLYLWNENGQKLFGQNEIKDKIAFFIMIASGINLGLTGLLGNNIGMSLLSGSLVFLVTAAAYIWSAYHLYRRWKANGEKLF